MLILAPNTDDCVERDSYSAHIHERINEEKMNCEHKRSQRNRVDLV